MTVTITKHYMNVRFWMATSVLLITLAATSLVVTVMLQNQLIKAHYSVAFNDLNNANGNLQLELARLYLDPSDTPDRRNAQLAYRELLSVYHALRSADPDGEELIGDFANDDLGARLSEIIDRYETAAQADAVHHLMGVGEMPEELEEIWEAARVDEAAFSDGALEFLLADYLVRAEPLLHGQSRLSTDEVRIAQELETMATTRIKPQLALISRKLHGLIEANMQIAMRYVLAPIIIATLVALFNMLVVFRPLQSKVLKSQNDLVQERDRAVAADVAKQNFLSMVSHELRTPMNGVLGFAGILLSADLKPEHRRHVEIIQSSGKSLLYLLNDILDFSKLESGQMELEKENFSIETAVTDVVDMMRGNVQAKRLEMSVFLDPDIPDKLSGDGNRLRQVLINLVGNAVKFTESGNIAVEVRHEAATLSTHQILFSVTDTGVGVPTDKRERIFERFSQVDNSARRKFEGTGLGLAICKQLVTMMGGEIWVESTEGVGSTFFVRVSLAEANPPEAVSTFQYQAVAALSGRKALVVDDHAVNRRVMRLQLESYGLQVDDAPDAAAGMRRLIAAGEAGAHYDFAIIDYMMPGRDGVQMAAEIRANGALEGVTLVLASSAAMERGDTPENLGFDAVLQKPVLPRNLIETLVDHSPALRMAEGPAIDANARSLALPKSEAGAQAQPGQVRILLAEDNAVSQQLVARILSDARYCVDTVGDGMEAVRNAARLPYDLILMDIRMPVMGGVEATRRIHDLGGDKGRIPIIALTANVMPEEVEEYLAAGMCCVIEKPIDGDTLLHQIDAALDAADAPPRDGEFTAASNG